MLPRQADCFQDRAAAAQLEQAVAEGGTVVLGQVLAGMGGVGKTQLAAHHARQAWDKGEVDLLVWVTAATRTAVVSAYAQAAADLLGADPADPERAAAAFVAWLQPKPDGDPRRWLVVLDDLADPADLRNLWPPASPYGRTLVTTRRREAALAGSNQRLVPVGLFSEDEALAYLTATLASRGRTEPGHELAALAADLGHLPLALSQAAAYLINEDLHCAAYRTLLADHALALNELLPDASGLLDDQTATAAAVWDLSLKRADQTPPHGLARPMLQLTAYLDPNGIPDTVLTSSPALTYLTEHRTGTAEPATTVTSRDAVRALRTLHRFSLINHNTTSHHQAVRVHQIIQRAVRDALIQQQRDQLARTAADALSSAWPDIERDTALSQALRANTNALTRHSEDALYQHDRVHPVVFRAGESLGKTGQAVAALRHFQHLTTAARTRLGPDHPDTLAACHSHARWRGEAGANAAGVAGDLTELLASSLRILGPDHPNTLAIRHSHAHWRGQAGDPAGAATAYAELLADRERVLGPDDLNILATRHSHAHWRGQAGANAAGVAAEFAELLTDSLRILGPDHPNTLATRSNLAHWRGKAGDPAGAATAHAELLADEELILGPDHPSTLTTRHNVAQWRGKAGDAAGAATALAELLPDLQRVLGPDHPHTLTTQSNLAHWRGKAGDAAGSHPAD
ncbi:MULTISPECIES: tetratricopeptide repeat protein [unclassified Streptomyces]|uniref:tetratricopeptide repeat protein n=1 Tax=unclassified Streptomyces TaxID=2593676 RepID=UPI00223F2DEB|nr:MULTISPECIES: tetratricopeptide repeat protein [unclassified Streptomyces]